MATVSVRLEGGEELLRKLERLDVNVKGALRAAGEAAADVIQGVANSRAPGPHVETDVLRATGSFVEVAVGPDKEHWYYRFHETGAAPHEITGSPLAFEGDVGTVITSQVAHTGMAAAPFLRPAMDEKQDDAVDAAGDRLRLAVEAV